MLKGQDGSRRSDDDDPAPTETNDGQSPAGRLKLFATLFGVIGTLLALAVPFLPVDYEITTLKWPTAEGTQSVSAPLVSYSPVWMDAQIPCSAAQSLDERTPGNGTLLSTNPPSSENGNLTGLVLRVADDHVTMLSKGQQIGTAPMTPGNCDISLHSDAYGTKVSVGDESLVNVAGDQRPQLTGIYSDLDEQADDTAGLSFEAQVDNRYESVATPLKIAAIAGAVIAFLGSIVCLRRLDMRAGRRAPRLIPSGWWKPTLRDVSVYGALVVWWVMGAMTSDDGYILTIARARESLGYISNYYRWFAVPEAPFGWFYELYSLWVQVSTATPWVRLPALLMGCLSWLLISREVLPRLGQQVRRSSAAGWAAAAVFLAFWLPYNNGLRPEPVVVLFSLLALCAVERAVATARLMPAALGLFVAALAVGANPHGLVAVLPFVAAIKPLFRVVHKRAQQYGWLPVLAPIASAGFVILTVVFIDQTMQSVLDATELRSTLGPSQSWYEELSRYNLLFSPTADGSMTRRFPVLLVILCLVTCAVVLLRRGRIRGAALGPSRRLLAVTAMAFVVLALTPTKWSHHFGMFAAFGGALAALTALATSSTVLRSKRNRAVFFAGLLVILAFATTGPNAWWYVSGWGVPWFNIPPEIFGYSLSTLFLVAAAITLIVAVVEHLRIDEHNPEVVDERFTREEKSSRALRLGTAPLSIICALLVLFELANFGKVVQKQWGSFSMGADNVRQIAGSSCGLSDYVYVETNPKDAMLRVSENQPGTSAQPADSKVKVPAKRLDGDETADEYLKAKLEGFNQPGLPRSENPTDPDEPDFNPPHQFGDEQAPVWGSYEQGGTSTGELRTQWYDLPERARSGEVPVVLSLAGNELGANAMVLEFGRDTEDGFEVMERKPVAEQGSPEWRDFRYTLDEKAKGAEKVRVVGVDNAVGPRGWVAVSAPRAPQLVNMTDFVGDRPAFVEWTAALTHPCLDIPGITNGVAEIPKFRVAAGSEVREIGQGWSSPDAGGTFGWLNVATSMREMPTYLRNNIHRDWGSLYAVDPYEPEALPAQAAMEVHREVHWGTWTPGPLTKTVQLPGDVPNSDDRNDVEPIDDGTEDQGGGTGG